MLEVQDEQPISHKSATTAVMENFNHTEPPPKYQKISRENNSPREKEDEEFSKGEGAIINVEGTSCHIAEECR